MKRKPRVLIAHDHLLIRESMRLLLREESCEVCNISGVGDDALKELWRHRPDVVLLALQILPRNAVAAIRQIKRQLPEMELVIFGSHAGDSCVKQLFAAGIKSFIGKDDSTEVLLAAIRSAARHKPFFTSEISDVLFSRFACADELADGAMLSTREHQILARIGAGKTNKEIAADLGISIRTAETHRAALMRKTHTSSTAELVRYAIRHRIIEA